MRSGVFFLLFISFCWNSFAQEEPCTSDDIHGDYTRCLSLNDTRTLYYYYGLCDPSNAPAPPAPITGFPCDIDCDPGYYLPLNETTCSICEPGTYSLGGGESFYHWEDNFPKTASAVFQTYCSESNSVEPSDDLLFCGWTLDGYDTQSGDLEGLDSVNSILELSLVLLEDGEVVFEYMCDIESTGDAFAYKIDQSSPVALPLTAEYTQFSVPLSAGTHSFRWIFYKNPETGVGDGAARINWVEIFGISPSDDKSCTPCPRGTYQPEEGQQLCYKCPINTYAPEEGSSECLPCTNGYSFAGAFECQPFEGNCTVENDSVAFHTNCTYDGSSWTRTEYYQWSAPLFCDSRNISLPENITNQECSPCAPGSYLSSENECIYCSGGTYSSDGSSCEPCAPGSSAINEVYYTEWDSWPQGFETFCYGGCSTDGWQLYSDFVRASLNTGTETDLLLSINVDIHFGGSISFTWAIDGSMNDSRFQITIDGEFVAVESHGHGTEEFLLSYGSHSIGFWAHGDGTTSSQVEISSIVIKGSDVGGASTCDLCPLGYYQPSSESQYCYTCPPGHFSSNEGATECSLCPEDTFSSLSGMDTCHPCPTGTHSNPGSSYCQNPDCTYETEDGEYIYNLSPYTGVPQFVNNEQDDFPGRYIVSYCGTLYESDAPCSNSYICESFDDFNPFAPTRNYLSWAQEVTFVENPDPMEGFSLLYTGGETSGCNGLNRTAVLNFICESDATKYTALEYSADESSTCQAVFNQVTVYGCKVCVFEDFERKEGECEGGSMEVEYVKKDGVTCNGYIRSTVESCGDLSVNFGMAIILVVVVLIVILVLLVVIVWFIMKNQRIQTKYSKLKATTVEMSDLEEEEVELEEELED